MWNPTEIDFLLVNTENLQKEYGILIIYFLDTKIIKIKSFSLDFFKIIYIQKLEYCFHL